MFLQTRTPVDSMEDALAGLRRKVGKINMFFPSTEERDRARKVIEPCGFSYCFQHPQNFEINRAGVNKGSALARLAGRLGLTSKEVMAIGDNNNDLPMLQYAGIAVAMENALAGVKERADFVTHSNDEDGVAYALYQFLR